MKNSSKSAHDFSIRMPDLELRPACPALPGMASTGTWDQTYTFLTRPRLNTSFVWHKAQTPSNYYYYHYYYHYCYYCCCCC